MRRLLLALLFLLGPVQAWAQGWTEPTITPDLMTAPLTPPPVTGTTFYVDRNNLGGTCNNSNPGTQTQPWCTIAKALATLTAGQRAYVRTGTYPEGFLHPTNQGTAGNYITLAAFPGEFPQINCAGNTFCWDGSNFAWAYIVWDGFDAYNPTQQHLSCENATCHHLWFINSKFHDGSTQSAHDNPGFSFESAAHHIVWSNNEAYNNPVHPIGANGHEIIIEFNHLYNNGRNGDDEGAAKCGAGAVYNCIMRYNLVHDNWRDPANSASLCFNPGACQGVSGLYIDIGVDGSHAGAMSYIYNNVVYNNDIGLQLYNSSGGRIFNNIVYNNGFTAGFAAGFTTQFGYGITVDSTGSTNVQVANNVSYGNRSRGFNYGGTPTGELISRNNIGMNNGVQFAQFAVTNANLNNDLMFSNNGTPLINWGGTNYTSLATFQARGGNTTWLNAVAANPLFVDAATGNFQLQSGSPALDVGATQTLFTFDKNNVTRPQGAAWDLGAYERVVATSAPPTVTITTNGGAGVGANFSTTGSPMSPILQGTASDDVAVASVSVACVPSCGAPTVTGTTAWSVTTLPLQVGSNVITVTAMDGEGQSATDTITVTLTVVSGTTILRIIR